MAERCAVVGTGQTKCTAARTDVSIAGLVREAAKRALEDASMDWSDIDAVVIGKAPDMFEGVMMPELYLAPALGAVGKPMLRVHTAGSVGGSTAIVAAHLVTSGVHRRVLTVAFEKQSDSNAMWALSVPQPFSAPLLAGAGGYFAPLIRAYIRRSNAPDHIGIKVAVKDRLHALKNPYAHLHLEDISFEMVRDSVMLWDPLRYLEVCPSSDGAAAMVLASEDVADASSNPAWIHGMAMRSEPTMFAGRDQVSPRASKRVCRRRLLTGRDHRAAPRLPGRRGLRAVQLVRADVAGEPRLRPRRRGMEAHRRRVRPRSTAATSRGTHLEECCPRTRSVPRACSAFSRQPCRREAQQVSIRSTRSADPSAMPTVAGLSTSPCGYSAPTSLEPMPPNADRERPRLGCAVCWERLHGTSDVRRPVFLRLASIRVSFTEGSSTSAAGRANTRLMAAELGLSVTGVDVAPTAIRACATQSRGAQARSTFRRVGCLRPAGARRAFRDGARLRCLPRLRRRRPSIVS